MPSYKALKVYQDESSQSVTARFTDLEVPTLNAQEVLIRCRFSSLNYKDALGLTGKGKIFKRFPIVPGIDCAGEVVASQTPGLPVGLQVLVTGCGMGERQDGGYAELVKVPAAWVVPLPQGLSLREAMQLGTAGFTAALCLHRMEVNGQSPDLGPVLVTGASGGVGSLAIAMLAARGYEVIAVSGKKDLTDYLKRLGASAALDPAKLALPQKPLAAARWGGAIDNVGGAVLSGILPQIAPWGNVACVGLALSSDLHASVLPLILRGVSLLGISSTNCPSELRRQLWSRLAGELKPKELDFIAHKEISLEGLEAASQQMLANRLHGRAVVKLHHSQAEG